MKDPVAPGRYPRRVFKSSSVIDGPPGWKERSGQTVEVMRELDETERDEEVGPMFIVRFEDGIEAHAFDDELVKP